MFRNPMKLAPCLVAIGMLAACASSDFVRTDGVSKGAGNSAAANTVMQMVDPWQRGVEDTDLDVPAVRRQTAEAADATSETTDN